MNDLHTYLRLPRFLLLPWQWSPAHQRTAHRGRQIGPCQRYPSHWPLILQTTWSAARGP